MEITWYPDNAYSAVDAWKNSQAMMATFQRALDAKKAEESNA
jgi:hypothetical protein